MPKIKAEAMKKSAPKEVKEVAKKKVAKIEPAVRLRGMKDFLPDEYRYFSFVSKKAEEIATSYGFKRLDTPIIENLSLYERSSGKTSDIVTKEMYSFIDKSGDKVALRPEATPGIARVFIEHGLFTMPQPVKTCWIGPIFRHEKPQAGRYRQHHQFNLDVFGEEGPIADAQIILAGFNFFKDLGIDIQVQINSIGCPDCRAKYLNKMMQYYKERGKRSKLCLDCKKRLLKNPLRILDCKETQCQEVSANVPQIVDDLCEPCKNHFIKVLEYLDVVNVPYNLNPRLVRGLDYYTRTVFEFSAMEDVTIETEEGGENKSESRQLSLGGGGRYDGLIEYMGGRPTPACGFGIGIERVITRIRAKNVVLPDEAKADIFVGQLGEQARLKALVLFEEIRQAGYQVREAFTKSNLKNQLEEADRVGVKFALIIGQKELIDNTVLIRDMESGIQEIVDHKKIIHELDKRLKNR